MLKQPKGSFLLSLVLIIALLGLTSCGFHLRGQGFELTDKQVWLVSDNPNADFERTLKQNLTNQGAKLVAEPLRSSTKLLIQGYEVVERTVARDSLGRASELELELSLDYYLYTLTEEPTKQNMQARREFAYDRNLATGQTNERQALLKDMYQELISRLLLQLAKHSEQQG